MRDWSQMGVEEQAMFTIALFPDLSDEQTNDILTRWSTNDYADTWDGHTEAMNDLLLMCRWESISEEQQHDEIERRRKG